jgi:hypothetical protein
MFDRLQTRGPIASFAVPPHAPPAAARAIAKFEKVGDAYGAIQGAISDVEEAQAQAVTEARAQAVEDAKAGKKASVSVVDVENEYARKLADLKGQEQVLRAAVDEVGNELALAIAENRADWLANLEAEASEIEARYDKAVAEGQAALADLGPARGGVRWLQEFSHSRARIGQESQFSGGQVTLRYRFPGTLQTDWNPRELLAAAAEVTSPAESKPVVAVGR